MSDVPIQLMVAAFTEDGITLAGLTAVTGASNEDFED